MRLIGIGLTAAAVSLWLLLWPTHAMVLGTRVNCGAPFVWLTSSSSQNPLTIELCRPDGQTHAMGGLAAGIAGAGLAVTGLLRGPSRRRL